MIRIHELLKEMTCEYNGIKDGKKMDQADLDQILVSTVVYDSRKICPGCMFICIAGARFDGHQFAAQAVEQGATVLVVEREVSVPGDIIQIKVPNTRFAMAYIAAAYFGHPADQMKIIGITGTKGKTTTTYLIKSILEHTGYKVGLVGTIETIIGDRKIPASNTTPESFVLQQYFREMADAGCDVVVMEVSSQGLMLHRTQGFVFDIGVFTNIAPDHIGKDEHKDFQDYLNCKSLLFRQCKTGILNGDDEHLEEMIKDHTCQVETFGLGEKNDLRGEDIRLVNGGSFLGVRFLVSGLENFEAEVEMPGKFSVYNALTAIAVCRHFNIEEESLKMALKHARVKGRIEIVPVSDSFTLMIDYAHNAMSLMSLLTTLKEYNPKRLVCLFGCGGNRAKGRRYEMGEVSGRLADLTVITSDNPREEEPQDIINDIRTGMEKTTGKYIEIIDRKEAITHVIHNGQPGDVIVLAGKGHEDYQEIKGIKYPMDERDIIAEVLKGAG